MYPIIYRGDNMKIRLRYILLIAAFVLVFGLAKNINKNSQSYNEIAAKTETLGYQEQDISVIKAITKLRPGESGIITLQGQPGTKYTIKSSYVRGDNAFNVTRQQTADQSGKVSFTWTAERDTTPGVYPIVITGGGKIINLYHTVLP